MRLFLVACIFAGISFQALSQSPDAVIPKGYYVIIGAFSVRDNAAGFHKQVTAGGTAAGVGFVPSRQLYYVFLDLDKTLTTCLDQVKVARASQFSDAWVRMIEEESSVTKSTPPVQEPVTQTTVAEVATPATAPVETVEEEEEPSEPLKIIPVSEMTLGNTEAFLSLYNEANDRVVKGKVQVVDTERGRLMTEIEGNSYLNISDPKSKSGRLSLICRAFGYRTVQQEITFVKPLNDSTATFIEDMGTALIIKFPLVRYQKGDIEVLYNVYFYNDAAIFLPESRFELNELLRMMQENEKYRIRLHGHANGNYHGKIIEVGPSKNFFAVTDDAVNKIGSAKELSESRAQVIKDYLVANGIAEDRMEVKAWGGKKPLYDKKGANAKKNIRVEVEVLSE
jgi:outer membrane protein OmpA-like peptidoglycan-associated protein